MTNHSVVIAGGGPTGLMLAGELALAGVDVAVVERRPNQELSGARALGISSRTIEVLDQRGIADRFLSAGQIAQITGFGRHALGHQRLSDPPQLRSRAAAEAHRAHPRRLGHRAQGADPLRPRNHGICAARRRRRRRTRRRAVIARAISRRVRRWTQPHTQDRGHRLPGLGSDYEQHPRGSGDDGEAAVRRASFGRRRVCLRQVGVRDQRRRNHL